MSLLSLGYFNSPDTISTAPVALQASPSVREPAILSQVLEVPIRHWGLPLAKNVMKVVRHPLIRNEQSRRLSGAEEQRLLSVCDAGRTPYFKPLLILEAGVTLPQA